MDQHASPHLEPDEIRRSPAAPRAGRALRNMGYAGALCLAGYGGAMGFSWLVGDKPLPSADRIASVKIGPVEPMPDIKDGVPAVMPKGVRVIPTGPGQPGEVAPAPKPAELAALPKPAGQEPTIETLLQPQPAKPLVAAPAKPAPAPAKPAAPVEAKPGPSGPADQTAALPAPPLPPRPARPAAERPVAERPAAERPAAEAKRDKPTEKVVAERPATERPLPPERSAAEAKRDKPAERVAAVPAKPNAAAPRRPVEAAAAPVQPEIAAAPVEEEDVKVFGLPVPGGRQIKRAAQTVADAVTGLPEKF